MRAKIKKHLDRVLSHLYINPLERCNLACKICYTRKTAPILSEREILEFIGRFEKEKKLQTITFCGGEVFTLKYFPGLVNTLTKPPSVIPAKAGIHANKSYGSRVKPGMTKNVYRSRHPLFVQIITNGTIDRLEEFENPNFVNLIVSIDGLKNYHDANRGTGNFEKSIGFVKKAQSLGFHTEIFSIVTRQNLNQIDEFEEYIYSVINSENVGDPSTSLRMTRNKIPVTYHPRKPPAYLLHHPESNVFGEVKDFDFLTDGEMIKIMKQRRTFPPKGLGCYQIALVSDGRVFGCCEGTYPLGKMTDEVNYLFGKLEERIEIWEKTNVLKNCLGCSQSEFMCGIKKYLFTLSSPT